jgi:type I restriction enzyme S subunit
MAGKDEKPDIRFSGFTDAWEQRKLGEIYTERNDRGDDSLQILSVSIHHGISNEELDSNTLGKKVRRSEDKSLYKHVYFGDLVLNMMRAWQGAIGVVKSEGMVSPAYITAIPSAQLYPLFMDYCLRRDETIIQMNNLSYGVTDFRKRLYWDSFINVLCRIPSVLEQERITVFFAHIDNLITLNQCKYDKLIIVKKSMLEKMFPKDGANVPEIRFSGFTDAWEHRRLGEIYNSIESGNRLPKNMLKEGAIPYVIAKTTENGVLMRIDKNTSDYHGNKMKMFPGGSITFSIDNPEAIFLQKEPFYTSNIMRVLYMKEYNTNHSAFILESIKRLAKNYNWSIKFSGPVVMNSSISLPISKYGKVNWIEIEKIGQIINSLDNLITLHRRKLEKLKNIKKAMLGKMFV